MKKIYVLLCLIVMTLPAFVQGSVILITPNGGENWIIGTPNTIHWITSAAPLPVKLELYKNGAFYLTICSQVPATQNSYVWTPPNSVIPGNTFKVKVTVLSSNTADYDFSDAYFTISNTCITVIMPNGGEIWHTGISYPITWIDCISEYTRIELWKGGVFYTTIATSASSPFNWTIPAAIAGGSDYKVKIIGLSSTASNTNFDFSDNNFTILQGPFITVTSPNGGEVWLRGTTRIITWLDNIPQNVRIELWKGGVYNSLISATTPSNGSCYWAIPVTQQSGNDYKVKILALPSSNTGLFDFSDNNFTILGTNVNPTALKSASTEGQGNAIKIFPNPCNNDLRVTIPDIGTSRASIEIMNMTGKIALHQVVQGSPDGENFTINTSALADGMYIFVIRNDQGILFRNALLVTH